MEKMNKQNHIDKRIILASASPRRVELLSKLVPSFDILPTNADENQNGISSAKDLVMFLALKKCQYCITHNAIDYNSLIISADTVVYCDKVLGKPKSKEDARSMIDSLSGRTHSVYTGVAIYNTSTKQFDVFYDRSDVTVKRISKSEIEEYIQTDEPYDKAGSYAIQGAFGQYIESISGSYENIVGLPIQKLADKLNLCQNIYPLAALIPRIAN